MKYLCFMAFMLCAAFVHAQTKGMDTGANAPNTQQQIDAMQDLMNRINDPNHAEYQKAKAMRDALMAQQRLDATSQTVQQAKIAEQQKAAATLSPEAYDQWKREQASKTALPSNATLTPKKDEN